MTQTKGKKMTNNEMKNEIVKAATKRFTSPLTIIMRTELDPMKLGPLALDLFDELRIEGKLVEKKMTDNQGNNYQLYKVV